MRPQTALSAWLFRQGNTQACQYCFASADACATVTRLTSFSSRILSRPDSASFLLENPARKHVRLRKMIRQPTPVQNAIASNMMAAPLGCDGCSQNRQMQLKKLTTSRDSVARAATVEALWFALRHDHRHRQLCKDPCKSSGIHATPCRTM